MFDTMTFTKILGGFCGALLVFLLGGWAAESLYHTGGGHGDGHEPANVIDTGEDEGGEEAVEEGRPKNCSTSWKIPAVSRRAPR